MKKFKLVVVTTLVGALLTSNMMAAASFPKASSWAIAELTQAVNYNILAANSFDNYKAETSREEFCKLAVNVYEKLSGIAPQLPVNKPFSDTNDEIILKAYNVGIVNGTTSTVPTTFLPKNKITREEQAKMIENLIKACGFDQTVNRTFIEYKDMSQVSSWAVSSIKFLRQAGIMNGDNANMITPKSKITREQSVLLAKRTYEVYSGRDNKIALDNISIAIGETQASVVAKLGVASAIEDSSYGFKWHIYNGNYENYIQVGVQDSKVVALYSNAKNMLYGVVGPGTANKQVAKVLRGQTSADNKITFRNAGTTITYYFDKYNFNQVIGVMIVQDKYAIAPFLSNEAIASNERMIAYLQNSERAKYSRHELVPTDIVAQVAKTHSVDMVTQKYFSSINLKKENMEQRMRAAGLSYLAYGENILKNENDAMKAHSAMMNTVEQRNNILSKNYSQFGVGISNDGSVLYYTVDYAD